MAAALNQPIVGDGIRTTNYFQGRVLSAEDLATDQVADRKRRAHLGLAIGPGVVTGLTVAIETAGPAPVVSVEKGIAITAEGDTVELPSRVSLALLGEPGGGPSGPAGLFGPCSDAGPGVDLSGDGAYVLLLSPAQDYRERAPKVGLDPGDGIAGSCGARYLVEGAALRLAALPLAGRSDIAADFTAIAGLDDPASTAGPEQALRIVSRFRNRLAHLCLAGAAAAEHAESLRAGAPAVFDADPSILDEMRSGEAPAIRPCDVPLAVFYLDLFGLRFLDQWAARRLARPRIDKASLSLFPETGLERLLQFADHLDDVLTGTGNIAAVRVGDYFRHLPPAGWFPAQGSGVAGFSPSQFLSPHTRGVVGRMSAGQAAERLDVSLRHRAVDLQSGACLLVYDLDENAAALVAGEAGRRVRLFTARSINGPLARDGLALALEGLWQSARGLLRRVDQIDLPLQPATARADLAAAQQAVADTANRYAAVALARALDDADTLRVMTTLLDLQRALAARFGAIQFVGSQSFTSFSPSMSRAFAANMATAFFVSGLLQRLNGSLPGTGAPGLAQAIAAGNICAAIAAQENINAFLAGFSGEGAASGPAELSLVSSPNGQTVIPGGEAFPQVYEISNGTDRRLTFQLEASADAPNGDWGGAVTLTDPSGVAISALAVDSGATGRFIAAVAAPGDAAVGETATLAVRAFSPPPDLRDLTAQPLALLVGDSAGEAVDRTILIPEPAAPQLLQSFALSQARSLAFTLLYQAETGPATTAFDVAVVFEDPVAGWQVSIDDVLGTAEGPPGRFVEQVQLTSGQRRPLVVNLRAPATTGLTTRVRLVVTSRDLPVQIQAASPPDGAFFTLATPTG